MLIDHGKALGYPSSGVLLLVWESVKGCGLLVVALAASDPRAARARARRLVRLLDDGSAVKVVQGAGLPGLGSAAPAWCGGLALLDEAQSKSAGRRGSALLLLLVVLLVVRGGLALLDESQSKSAGRRRARRWPGAAGGSVKPGAAPAWSSA